MNDSNEKLSVCLLVYNHGHSLDKVITSILEQTISSFEFVISDDCSTDNSWHIIEKYALLFKNIKALKTSKNLGMAANANFAISHATGKYVALLHHDDDLTPLLLEKWLKVIKLSEKIAFVFCEYKLENGLLYHKKMGYKFMAKMNGKMFLNKYLLKYWGCPVRGTTLIRKKYFDEIGGFYEKFGMLADVDLWMRLSSKWEVGYVNEPLIEVRQERPESYPKIYKDFSWERRFILFDIHSSNINRDNYPNYFKFIIKRFVFRNRVSIEIIKWLIYGIIKGKAFIIKSFPSCGHKDEIIFSKIFANFIKAIY